MAGRGWGEGRNVWSCCAVGVYWRWHGSTKLSAGVQAAVGERWQALRVEDLSENGQLLSSFRNYNSTTHIVDARTYDGFFYDSSYEIHYKRDLRDTNCIHHVPTYYLLSVILYRNVSSCSETTTDNIHVPEIRLPRRERGQQWWPFMNGTTFWCYAAYFSKKYIFIRNWWFSFKHNFLEILHLSTLFPSFFWNFHKEIN